MYIHENDHFYSTLDCETLDEWVASKKYIILFSIILQRYPLKCDKSPHLSVMIKYNIISVISFDINYYTYLSLVLLSLASTFLVDDILSYTTRNIVPVLPRNRMKNTALAAGTCKGQRAKGKGQWNEHEK